MLVIIISNFLLCTSKPSISLLFSDLVSQIFFLVVRQPRLAISTFLSSFIMLCCIMRICLYYFRLSLSDTVRSSQVILFIVFNVHGRVYVPVFQIDGRTSSKTHYHFVSSQTFYQGDPVTDKIQDHIGEKILGRFYEDELSVIKKKDDMLRIDKVLKRKTMRSKMKRIWS